MAELVRRPAPTECAVGCGACCDPVLLSYPLATVTAWTADRWRSMGDPRDDAVWAEWPRMAHMVGATDDQRHLAIEVWDWCQEGGSRPNADFAAAHWRELLGPEQESYTGMHRVVCDAFDPHSRSCTVHGIPFDEGGQPPICSGYPHYGAEPGDPSVSYGLGMNPACSFNAEVRPFLTIVEVR